MFIEINLADSVIDKIVAANTYMSFITLASCIDFFGAVLENKGKENYFKRGQTRTRFERAIKDLFPPEYAAVSDLHEAYRGGVVHALAPKGVSFTTQDEANQLGFEHLKTIPATGRTLLISEKLVRHFKTAREIILSKIRAGEIKDIDFLPLWRP
jgi:hypothetical protein